jgi:hypothetical protein
MTGPKNCHVPFRVIDVRRRWIKKIPEFFLSMIMKPYAWLVRKKKNNGRTTRKFPKIPLGSV